MLAAPRTAVSPSQRLLSTLTPSTIRPQRSQLLTQRVEFGAICILRNVGIARHGAILVWAVDIPPAYDRQVTI